MFQILEFAEVKLTSLTSRAEHHGEDEVPATTMKFELIGPNTLLDMLDPTIRPTLYKAVDDQEELPGVEPSTPVLRCNSFGAIDIEKKYEGWTLQVDDNIDVTEPKTFGGCKVDAIVLEDAMQGGTVRLSFKVGTSDLDKVRSGLLGVSVKQPLWITLKAPEKQPDAIDGSVGAFKADHPEAGDIFAQGAGDSPPDDEEDADESEGGDTDVAGNDEPWPFPQKADGEAPPQSVTIETSRPGTRTARGREKTKAALAARAGAA